MIRRPPRSTPSKDRRQRQMCIRHRCWAKGAGQCCNCNWRTTRCNSPCQTFLYLSSPYLWPAVAATAAVVTEVVSDTSAVTQGLVAVRAVGQEKMNQTLWGNSWARAAKREIQETYQGKCSHRGAIRSVLGFWLQAKEILYQLWDFHAFLYNAFWRGLLVWRYRFA